MKHFKTIFLVTAITIVFAMNALPQIVVIGQSSEWDATAFNNGRRVVRDCSDPAGLIGYNHYVWHSQNNPANAPNGNNCDIFYACTDDFGAIVIPPTNLTAGMGFTDNRYPSIAIENFKYGGVAWRTYNTLHVVWQCKQGPNAFYEIMYGSIPVANPPAGPVALGGVQNLSQTPARNSLVPAIDINHFTPGAPANQHIHVVWQEEHVPHPLVGVFASDIFYTRSVNSGVNFNGVGGGRWDNITNTSLDSQMPSIACAIDTFFGFPVVLGDCIYPTDDVHVAYNENTAAGGIHVYYLHSLNDGLAWPAPQDITVAMGGGPAALEGYPNISCDMLDNAHIVYMCNVGPHSPFATGYLAGISPNNIISFPGPNPGMYGGLVNNIVYWSSNAGANPLPALPVIFDREFPTAALDRFQNVTLNWQECQMVAGVPGDYEVKRDYCFNLNAPARPLPVPVYGAWAAALANDSNDAANEDLFPNLAHKKVSMYLIRVAPFPGFTEIWNKVMGLGVGACVAANPKNINMLSNTQKDPAI